MELTYDQALYRAAALCTKSEHCESDIRKKLADWNINTIDSNKIITYLKQERYLDEIRFCRFFVKDKMRFNKWGRKKTMLALKIKGITPETIKTEIENIDTEQYLDTLQNILCSKNRNMKFKDQYDHRQKLIRFGLSRGFEMDIVLKTVDSILKDEKN